MKMLLAAQALCASLSADTIAGNKDAFKAKQQDIAALFTGAPKEEQVILAHKLATASAFLGPKGLTLGAGGKLKEKKAPQEFQGFENAASITEMLSGIKACATDKKYTCEGRIPAMLPAGNNSKGKPAFSHGFLPVVFLRYPAQQDNVGALRSDALDGALRGISESDRAKMLRTLLASENPDNVAGLEDDYDSVADLVEGIRRQARVVSRNEGRQAIINARGDKHASRDDRKAAAIQSRNNNLDHDDGSSFIAQDGKIYERTPQRRLLPVVNSSSTAGGQNSLANGVSGTYTGAPTMELEIIKLRVVVEGGATNVEIQETLVASLAITSLKIGSVELIVGTGGVEFPMGEAVDPTFWSCLVVVGGNSNLTVTVRNEGATQVFIITAYCRVVQPMA